jgi:NAD(P)-dependent dehydrogenase (short-subunit alcohol dehydrogenase family)
MRSLTGKVAVVTGGAGGIGTAMGRRFGQEGMKVVLADLRQEPLDETVATLRSEGFDVSGVVTDVTDYESVRHLASETVARHGAAHVICNNAGIGSVSEGYLWEYDLNDWRWGLDVNVLGVIYGIKAFVPMLIAQDEGHVVNTTSHNGGIAPMARAAIYPMTKAAVLTLTESLYAHLLKAGSNVHASALFPSGPGLLNTGIWESWRWRHERYPQTQERETPQQTLEAVVATMKEAGQTVSFAPLENIADQVVRGILDEQFWMLEELRGGEDNIARRRADSIINRTNPDYFNELGQRPAKL